MTNPPPTYIVHQVDERDVTVDWYFGPGHVGTKLAQTLLLVVGWFFLVLPVVITASALLNRDNPGAGWWSYPEGFAMWDLTIATLGIVIAFFIVGFLVLFLINRVRAKERNRRTTFDEQRLAQRVQLADAWYAGKFGPEPLRQRQRAVQIEPYGDVETFELRGLYRENGLR